ncbi:MAG: recombination protein RecR [SAR202 cluster bacterium]|jgi:recombination protein RecR|nr:MAG: recombination protein RecR [SAR202 cluster bacterium]MQG74691.1 recombination protein RecR [SAR202 cluster bacterium]|tara:strand:+ start:2395 stop:3006 length:612 start_codon:yes stop_codon:yes gene_type:complete
MVGDSRGATPPVQRLIDEFNRLPGIGPKSAQRLTYHLIRMPVEQAESLASAITSMKNQIILCSVCFNITDTDPCDICLNNSRERSKLCVVEQPLDVVALERTSSFDGLYHVLHGSISPINGIGPEDLKIRELLERMRTESFDEIILAMNPNLEGEATSMYINRLIGDLGARITRPARGLPVGGDLEYADDATLGRALEGRQDF